MIIKSKYKRLLSFIIFIYFTLFSTFSYAQGVNLKTVDGIPFSGQIPIEIPQELGKVHPYSFPIYSSADKPLIVHIQDAHGQIEAQKNIVKILEHLHSDYGFNTLFLEGGMEVEISRNLLKFFK